MNTTEATITQLARQLEDALRENAALHKLRLDIMALSDPHSMRAGGLSYSERLAIIQKLSNDTLKSAKDETP